MSDGLKFREHLDELRKRLKLVFLSYVALVIFVLLLPLNPRELLSLTTVYYTTPVSVFLTRIRTDLLPQGWTLLGFHVNQPLEIILIASLILAAAIDMPLIAYEVFKFIDPALKDTERKAVYPVVFSATALFITGILFGYFVLARFIFLALSPFFQAVGASFQIEAADFYSIVFLSVLFSGAAFTTPVFVYLLIRFRVLSPQFFSKNRLIIWVVTYIVTAFITPDGGPVLDIILFVPVIGLLEGAVLVARKTLPKDFEPRQEAPRCRYCDSRLGENEQFCGTCGRANMWNTGKE